MGSKLLIFCASLIIAINFSNCEKVKTTINVRQCEDTSLQYVFVATLSGTHFPVDYTGGYEVFGNNPKDEETTLLNAGAKEAHDFGKYLAKEYGKKLGSQENKLEQKYFRFFKSSYKRFEQTGQVISLGLLGETINVNMSDPGNNYTENAEGNTAKSIDGNEFLTFLDPSTCSEYYDKMSNTRGNTETENWIEKYRNEVKNKEEKKPWGGYKGFDSSTTESSVDKKTESKVLPLLKESTRDDAYKMMLLYEALEQKKWTGKRFEEQLGHWTDDDEESIRKLTLWLGKLTGSKDDIKTLTAGRLLDEVFKQMENVRQNKSITDHLLKDNKQSSNTKTTEDNGDVKLVIFPGPSMVLAGLIGTFNGNEYYNQETAFYPRQGAEFIIELYSSCNNDVWFYKAKYKSQASRSITEVYLPKIYDTNDVQTIYRHDVTNMLAKIRVDNSTYLGQLCNPSKSS